VRVSFVRTGERHDHVYVERDDGTTLDWAWPAGGLPHDLVHLVAERHLGMGDGIWGRVARGEDFPARPTPPGALQAAQRAGDVEVIRSEAIAAAATRLLTVPDAPPPLLPEGCTDAQLQAIVEELRTLAGRWFALAPRTALVETFP
jgi:hypothetical protein